jgi:hypothetical protein
MDEEAGRHWRPAFLRFHLANELLCESELTNVPCSHEAVVTLARRLVCFHASDPIETWATIGRRSGRSGPQFPWLVLRAALASSATGSVRSSQIALRFRSTTWKLLRIAGRQTAAFIVEPIQGKGVHMPDDDYLSGAQDLCRKYGTTTNILIRKG